jgi:nicotinate phosphoribosyltransferase
MNGVYKLVAIKIPSSPPTRDEILYKFKTSPAKRTYPGPKQIYRILENGLIKNDFIALENEEQPSNSPPLLQKILDNSQRCRR